MKHYMLDTNMVSYFIKGHANVTERIVATPMSEICISSITAGELFFGLAKRPKARRLHTAVREFMKCVEILSWDNSSAECYGISRATMEAFGKTLAPLDLLIASHALAENAILVTHDRAFSQLSELVIEDLTQLS